MTKMYIANCTRQNWELKYTMPGARAPRTQVVDAGGQVQISGDLTSNEIEAIVEQFAVYAMIPAADAARARSEISLIYSVGAPVTRNQMLAALERNLTAMDARGRQQRDAAGVAVAKIMESNDPTSFREAEFSVREERQDGGAPEVNEIVKVPRQGGAAGPSAPRGRGRPRKAA